MEARCAALAGSDKVGSGAEGAFTRTITRTDPYCLAAATTSGGTSGGGGGGWAPCDALALAPSRTSANAAKRERDRVAGLTRTDHLPVDVTGPDREAEAVSDGEVLEEPHAQRAVVVLPEEIRIPVTVYVTNPANSP